MSNFDRRITDESAADRHLKESIDLSVRAQCLLLDLAELEAKFGEFIAIIVEQYESQKG
ncbi:MAG: hypothetical protein PGN16_06315 [Sphingomonas phyllosphaerae]|uniref:hypothetical protein n=1 Tax=Sphingomonas phyllosphaerae TaxID=257003 RepID=UPI002FF65DD8